VNEKKGGGTSACQRERKRDKKIEFGGTALRFFVGKRGKLLERGGRKKKPNFPLEKGACPRSRGKNAS